MKVAALVPAATEIVLSLGLGDRLVAGSDASVAAAALDVLITDESVVGPSDLGSATRVILSPHSLEDVWSDVVRVGRALGLGMTAEAVANGFKSRVEKVARRLPATRPTVFFAAATAPWMADVIRAAGGRAADAPNDADVVVSIGPDVFDTTSTASSERFAVRDYALFTRPGPRLVEAIETLAAILHPDVFPDLVARHAARYDKITPTGAVSDIS